ncbi:hypothetical protein HMPREF1129_2691 [Actinomyces naeslundii str. Howell 279]|uniref:Uncharacterized protein n=1 Tax=Actinomyces naeslundii (strain ATCC 12104 / DSM 43013 / CCUG 2238 / JCM 8349 / NCTC 10301 / Howell 279) TaxID=1115803 RepID=J3JJF2_ACTNH|nr:hypothetical protein HMPREF1129_2691 [Actinomyces naeslundii str. Howell 279]
MESCGFTPSRRRRSTPLSPIWTFLVLLWLLMVLTWLLAAVDRWAAPCLV